MSCDRSYDSLLYDYGPNGLVEEPHKGWSTTKGWQNAMYAKTKRAALTVLTAAAILFAAITGTAITAPTAAAAPTIATPVAAELFRPAPAKNNNWAADTAKFAGCLGGFGFVAAPVVVGFMFGGPGGAVSAARAWIPRLGPVGAGILKWCMASVLGVRM
jgi:hypothetical protein